jgi:hypothetical protein
VIATGFPTPHRYATGYERKETFGVIKNVDSNPIPVNSTTVNQNQSNIRSFFGSVSKPVEIVPKTEEIEEVEMDDEEIIDDEDEKEEEVLTPKATQKTAKIFEKKQETAKKEVEVVAEIDDSDDWSSSIPSILRRNR